MCRAAAYSGDDGIHSLCPCGQRSFGPIGSYPIDKAGLFHSVGGTYEQLSVSINLDWVGALLHLKEFYFRCWDNVDVRLGRHAGALSHLKVLSVQVLGAASLTKNKKSLLRLCVPWKHLHVLESVYLSGNASSEILLRDLAQRSWT